MIGGAERRSYILRGALSHNEHSSSEASRMHLRIVVDYSAHDHVVRPGGAMRTRILCRALPDNSAESTMLWEVAHARLHYVDCLWPDFTARDLQRALEC